MTNLLVASLPVKKKGQLGNANAVEINVMHVLCSEFINSHREDIVFGHKKTFFMKPRHLGTMKKGGGHGVEAKFT